MFKTMDDVLNYAKNLPDEAKELVMFTFQELEEGEIDEAEAAENLIAIFNNFELIQ